MTAAIRPGETVEEWARRDWLKIRRSARWRDFRRRRAAGLVGGHIFHRSGGGIVACPEIESLEWSQRVENRPLRSCIEVLPGGIAFKKEQPKGTGKATGGGGRSEVVGFSKNSRKRLMDVLMSFDFDKYSASGKRSPAARSMFCTLTYSDDAPAVDPQKTINFTQPGMRWFPAWWKREKYEFSWKLIKRDLDTFGKRLRRLKNFSGLLWKMEIVQRKSGRFKGAWIPHFHCLILFKGVQRVNSFRRWLSGSWFNVVGSGDDKHLKAGTNALVAYGGATGKLFSYLGKYLGKTFEVEGIKAGRIWGIIAGQDNQKQRLKNPLELVQGKTIFTDRRDVWQAFIYRLRTWGKNSFYLSKMSEYQSAGVIFCSKKELPELLAPGVFERWKMPDLALIGG